MSLIQHIDPDDWGKPGKLPMAHDAYLKLLTSM